MNPRVLHRCGAVGPSVISSPAPAPTEEFPWQHHEKDLWDGSLSGKAGEFPTTILIVSRTSAAEHPDTVKALLKGHVKSVEWLNSATADEKAQVINAALKDGVETGTTKQADINGIFDLTALNEVTGEKTSAAGLGKE